MTVSSPADKRLGRVLQSARDRRVERLDRGRLRAELVNYRTTSELAELSGIAERHQDADTAELRSLVGQQLSC